jgi:hypothetical protein
MNWITANNRDPDDPATFNERSALIEERAELMFGEKPLSRPRRRGTHGSRKRGHK